MTLLSLRPPDQKPSARRRASGLRTLKNIYDSTRAEEEYVTVNHRAYLFTQQAGEYTFSMLPSNDIILVWIGLKAYSGFTRANVDIIQLHNTRSRTDFKQTFQQGEYVPIWIIYGNAAGSGTFITEITAPDGKVIIGSETTKESPYLIQYSCDRVEAPKFPPFGSET